MRGFVICDLLLIGEVRAHGDVTLLLEEESCRKLPHSAVFYFSCATDTSDLDCIARLLGVEVVACIEEEFAQIQPRTNHECHVRVVVVNIEITMNAFNLFGVSNAEYRTAKDSQYPNVESDRNGYLETFDRNLSIATTELTIDLVAISVRNHLKFR